MILVFFLQNLLLVEYIIAEHEVQPCWVGEGSKLNEAKDSLLLLREAMMRWREGVSVFQANSAARFP